MVDSFRNFIKQVPDSNISGIAMIGTPIRYHAPGDKLPAKHQLLVEFDDSSSLTCTVQMWGGMLCFDTEKGEAPKGFTAIKGPNPLEDGFDRAYFEELFASCKPKDSVKAFLATQQRIPGLGNGVLQDILFNARLNPRQRVDLLTEDDKERLFHSVKDTLLAMVAQGGRDTENDLFGVSGGYKTILSSKTAGKPCPVCGGGIVREAYLGGNVYFCPNCQPFKR
jgi:formamidopyrimidine-DNA glycosylase